MASEHVGKSDVEGLAGPGSGRNSGLGGQVRHSLPPLILEAKYMARRRVAGGTLRLELSQVRRRSLVEMRADIEFRVM